MDGDSHQRSVVDSSGREGKVPSVRAPGVWLGLGMGGFVDGILLHQVLQWHHMLSSTDRDHVGIPYYPVDTVRGLEMNTLWDGIFHVFCWLSVLVGLGMLYSRLADTHGSPWRSRALWGWILVGWGVFNLGEGIVDHHILGIHHVLPGENQLWWDLGFLAVGVVLIVAGWLVQRIGTSTAFSSHIR